MDFTVFFKGKSIRFYWFLASLVGGLFSVAVGGIVLVTVCKVTCGTPVPVSDGVFVPGLIQAYEVAGAITGLVASALIGCCQMWIIRYYLQRRAFWLIALMIAVIASSAMGGLIIRVPFNAYYHERHAIGEIFFVSVGMATVGIFVGLGEGIALRLAVEKMIWWVLANTVGWAAGWGLLIPLTFVKEDSVIFWVVGWILCWLIIGTRLFLPIRFRAWYTSG
jgi:hypothetical protein